MSHLTAPTPSFEAALGAGPLGVGVPGYGHPLLAPAEWGELHRLAQEGPHPYGGGPLHWAVLNVADGPGSRPDPHCLAAVARLRAATGPDRSAGGRRPGPRLLGHLNAAYGSRSFGELVSEAHRYLDWYGVDGFILDRCPTDRTHLAETRRVATTLRALTDDAYLVFRHGEHPCAGYAESADQLVTFAGPWTEYRWSQVAEWTADHPPERFCHLVHGIPRTHLEEALRIARWQGAGTVFFTDRRDTGAGDAWQTLPGYWDEFVSRIGPGVSE
ncbi:spherulation-specific family 4 protein [Streptomyces sp. NPDC042319]|uniref:spherulation-specific family 4 protein n=1 Tax=Streptomyces sp. NPDC042319 TaxID=3154332 RepID=UPI0033C20065